MPKVFSSCILSFNKILIYNYYHNHSQKRFSVFYASFICQSLLNIFSVWGLVSGIGFFGALLVGFLGALSVDRISWCLVSVLLVLYWRLVDGISWRLGQFCPIKREIVQGSLQVGSKQAFFPCIKYLLDNKSFWRSI